MGLLISFQQLWGIAEMRLWFPRVIRCWISLPLHLVCHLSELLAVSDNSFDFPFVVVADNLWWREGIVGSVCIILVIRSQQGGMEHGVYLPLVRQLEPIGQRSKNLGN